MNKLTQTKNNVISKIQNIIDIHHEEESKLYKLYSVRVRHSETTPKIVAGKYYGKNLPFSVKKAEMFLRHIRHLNISDMIAQLQVCDKKIGRYLLLGLKHAIKNLKYQCKIQNVKWQDTPRIIIYVGKGKCLRRIRPRARGRAFRIIKHRCHLRLVILSNVSKKHTIEDKVVGKKVKNKIKEDKK